jgi:WD40 repeat protein
VLAFRSTHPGTRAAIEAAEWLLRLPSPLDRWTAAPLSPLQKLDGQPKELLAVLGDHRSWICFGSGGYWVNVQYSSDGRWLACKCGHGTIRLYNPNHLTVKAVLKADEPQIDFDFRSDGKQLISAGMDGRIIIRDSRDGREMRSLKTPVPIVAAALAADGRHLAVGHVDGTIYFLRLADGS